MPQIIITNLFNKTLDVDPKCVNLLQALQSHYLDWMHACGGKGRCTTCKMEVLEGMENISSDSSAEAGYRDRGLLKQSERLTCQVTLSGDVKARVPEENKFPHIEYSDE